MKRRSSRFGQITQRVVGAIVVVGAVTVASPSDALAEICWRPPVTAGVADPFRQPSCPWCPGNRGIEFATAAGDAVFAAAPGTVSFVGPVAEINYVVVRLENGWRHTYGGLRNIRVKLGDPVITGMRIAEADGHLHFGLRDGEVYLDPAPYLGTLRWRLRLIPLLDETPVRPPTIPRVRCRKRSKPG